MAGYDLISYALGYRSFVIGTGMLSFVKVGQVPDEGDDTNDYCSNQSDPEDK